MGIFHMHQIKIPQQADNSVTVKVNDGNGNDVEKRWNMKNSSV